MLHEKVGKHGTGGSKLTGQTLPLELTKVMNNLVVLFKYLYALKILKQTIVEQSELELFTQ